MGRKSLSSKLRHWRKANEKHALMRRRVADPIELGGGGDGGGDGEKSGTDLRRHGAGDVGVNAVDGGTALQCDLPDAVRFGADEGDGQVRAVERDARDG